MRPSPYGMKEKNMTEENKGAVDTENINDAPQLKSVDFFGVKLDLPSDVADKVIQVRDEKVASYNDVASKLTQIESAAKQAEMARLEAERKAQALEAAKNNDLDKAKELLSEEYRDQISKYENYSVRMAVKNAVTTRSDLIAGAAEDVVSSVLGNNSWKLTDDFQVVNEEGKTVNDLVTEFVDARDYLRVADSKSPVRRGTPQKAQHKEELRGKAALQSGLNRLLGD